MDPSSTELTAHTAYKYISSIDVYNINTVN